VNARTTPLHTHTTEFATSTIKQNTYRYTGVHTDGAIADHDTANAANRVLVSASSLDNVSHFFRLRNFFFIFSASLARAALTMSVIFSACGTRISQESVPQCIY
jgi:hypothetical protein